MSARTWFITGSSRGVGREWTVAALEHGDRVAATARDPSGPDDLVERFGDDAIAFIAGWVACPQSATIGDTTSAQPSALQDGRRMRDDEGVADGANASERSSVKSADRALAVLDFVGERRTVRFSDLVSELGLPRSSAHGLLHTLTAAGWLELDPASRQYSLGLRAWQLGQRYVGHGDLATAAKPVMDELAQELGETIQLARLDGVENVYIAISEAPRPMRLASSVGMRLHSHGTGIGKALLAQLDPAEARRRLSAVALPKFTDHTITDVDALMSLLERIRVQGYALDDEEYLPGCRCVAVPLRLVDQNGGLIAAMSVTAPIFRCGPDWPHRPLQALQAAATRIVGRLSAPAA